MSVKALVAVVVALALAGLAGFQALRSVTPGREVLEQARSVVAKAAGYNEHREYCDYILEHAHRTAYANSRHVEHEVRSWKRVRTHRWFDDEQYMFELFPLMIEQATLDGSTHIVAALKKLQDDWENHAEKLESGG